MKIIENTKLFFTPKSYLLKHKLLIILKERAEYNVNKFIKLSEIQSYFQKIDKITLYDNLYVLFENKDLEFLHNFEDQDFLITKQGKKNCIEKEYIKKGQKERIEFIYDILKIIAAIIVVASFFRTVLLEFQNKKEVQFVMSKVIIMEKKIDSIEKNIENLN